MRISDWSSDVCSSDLIIGDEDDDDHPDEIGEHRRRNDEQRKQERIAPLGLVHQIDVEQPQREQAEQRLQARTRSEEHTSELQSLMRISYAVFCLKKKNKHK